MTSSSRYKALSELKVLIIEDDISFTTEVEMQLAEWGIKDISRAHTIDAAIAAIDKFEPDLALVDIRLNHDSEELKVSRYLKGRNIPFIIMTQFKEKELYRDISQLAPVAYFSKPLDYIALKYTVETFFNEPEIARSNGDAFGDLSENFLFVKKGNKYLKVKFRDMLFIQAEGNYVTIQTTNAKFIIRGSLKKSLKILPKNQFEQIHRNYVVNFRYVDVYDSEHNQVHVKEYIIPVGRSFKPIVRRLLKSYS